jgi:hypothetical protein
MNQRRSGNLPASSLVVAGVASPRQRLMPGSMYRTKPFMHQQAYALTRTAKRFRF